MSISKIKAWIALLTGGMAGIVKYVLEAFNKQVLGRITNKETAAKYIKDAQALSAFLGAILENHSADLSENRKAALKSILEAVDKLAVSLEDLQVSQAELDAIIEKVKAAIDAWKKAK